MRYCRISSESINDIRDSERTGENCLFKIRSDRLGYPERGDKGQDMDEEHRRNLNQKRFGHIVIGLQNSLCWLQMGHV